MLTFSCPFADNWPADWQRCINHFLQSIYQHSRSLDSLTAYRCHLKLFFTLIDKPPERITNADIREFLCTRFDGKEKPIASGTQDTRLAVLASFYEFASTYQVLSKHGKPVLLFTAIKPTLGIVANRPERTHRTLSEAELERFFKAIPDTPIGVRDRAIFTLFFYTARRRREIASLKWGDIERSMVTDELGNSRPGIVYRFRGKGRPFDDTAELPEPAYKAILAYLQRTKRLATMRPGDPLFLPAGKAGQNKRKDKNASLSSQTMYTQLKRYAVKAGLDPANVCLHSFRHASARQRYLRGEKPRSIQHLLRHRRLETTEIYLGAMISTSDNGAKLLEKRFAHLSIP